MNIQNKWKPIALGLIIAFSTIVIVNSFEEVSAVMDRYVGGGGTPNYATITQALAASSSGDTIYVAYGTYNENIVIQISINIIGVMSGPNRPIISGTNNNNPIIDIGTNNIEVNISNMEIDGASGNLVAGIRSSITTMDNHDVVIINCMIHGMTGYGSGILLNNAYSHWIYDCNIFDNYYGVYIDSSDSNLINFCDIHNNEYDGIYVYGDDNTIDSNMIYDNGFCGVELYYSDDCTIGSYSEIYENEYGIYAYECDDFTIVGTADEDHLYQVFVHNNTYNGIVLDYCDNLQISYTSTDDNGDDFRDGLVTYYCDNNIMDHVLFWDSMYCYNCDTWAISYYHIINYYLYLCTNYSWSNPI